LRPLQNGRSVTDHVRTERADGRRREEILALADGFALHTDEDRRASAEFIRAMAYRSTRDVVLDLERNRDLIRITQEVDPHLEMAEIHRRVWQAGGPALYFANVKGSRFPAASNLFGNIERARFVFRKTLRGVKALIQGKADPKVLLGRPLDLLAAPFAGVHALPLPALRAPVMQQEVALSELPQIQSWPRDGGAFVTLPRF